MNGKHSLKLLGGGFLQKRPACHSLYTSFVGRVSKAAAVRTPSDSVATYTTSPENATAAPSHCLILLIGEKEGDGGTTPPQATGEHVHPLAYARRDRYGAGTHE